jgi:SAM-dependent methyltransferase
MNAPADRNEPQHGHGPGDGHGHGHGHGFQPGEGRIPAGHADRLMDPARLATQLSEADLARLLALRGDEDIIELGSGAGFYTDRIAAFTTGTVYGLDIQPEMHEFYRSRGLPANVRLILGNVLDLDLAPASIDVAVSISTWHESDGVIDFAGLARALRPDGRLVVIDWRRDAESDEHGPPMGIRFTKDEVVAALAPCFTATAVEDLGESMFAVTATRRDQPEGCAPA